MDKNSDLLERETISEEREAALLSGVGDHEQTDTNKDEGESIMAMMAAMSENMNSVLKRLSTVEAAKERPAKKRRVSETIESIEDEQLSEAEGEISDSEELTNTVAEDDKEADEAPVSNTSVAEDDLLTEIAQDFADQAQTGPNVSQKLAEIINQRWSSKLEESKLKSKMEKYERPNNCEKLAVPKVNPEIWSKLSHSTRVFGS